MLKVLQRAGKTAYTISFCCVNDGFNWFFTLKFANVYDAMREVVVCMAEDSKDNPMYPLMTASTIHIQEKKKPKLLMMMMTSAVEVIQ